MKTARNPCSFWLGKKRARTGHCGPPALGVWLGTVPGQLKYVRVELHCHSVVSDGDQPVVEVARRARDRGAQVFALTDHDSLAGFSATQSFAQADFQVLRGVELSAVMGQKTVHILLYGHADQDWSSLEEYLVTARARRVERLKEMAERLAARGLPIDLDAILGPGGNGEKAHGRSVGRPDLAQALVAAGHVATTQDAFKRYLYDGSPSYIPSARLDVPGALALGAACGAKMSLAHPHTLGSDAETLLAKHRGDGLEGVEVFYGAYPDKARRKWLAVADAHALVATGGSDFHGATLPQITELGVDVPLARAERLLAWLGVEMPAAAVG